MRFSNEYYQKIHDKMAKEHKKRTGRDFDEDFDKWNKNGSQIYKPGEEFDKSFEEFKRKGSNPYREENEINALRMIEERKRKKKSKPKTKRCRCK